ncbi:MAG: EAL domain-containing protein [Lachnospiraceae bacterium]|nr:EAL domain-containing protein [Lachnospiraceae bacterium]
MDTAVQILIVFMAFVLLFCCIITVKSKIEYMGSLVRLYLCAIATMFAYFMFLFTGTKEQALFFDGVYFVCTDWLVICMLHFCADYTKVYKRHKYDAAIIYGIAALDTVALLFNNVWQFMFDIVMRMHPETGKIYRIENFKFPHYIHLSFCYIIIFFAFVLLINRALKSPEIYNKAYISMLASFLGVVICNCICYSLNLQIDVSVLLYAVLASIICYLSVLAAPKTLVNRMLEKVNSEIKDALICHDVYGNLVYANQTAKSIFLDESNADSRKNSRIMKDKFYNFEAADKADMEESTVTMLVNGEKRYFTVELINLTDGEFNVGLLVKMIDKTNEIKAFEEDKLRAAYDSLTGIYNRESFFKEASKSLEKDPDTPRYMIASDIKDFKMINEIFGEKTGDEILKKQAMLIKKYSHKANVYGRISSNGFAIFMPCKYYNEDKILKIIKSMQSIISDGIYKMHVYIGVYKATDMTESVEIMYDKARMTIEAVKGDYQRVFMHYDDRMMKQMVYENNILSEFGAAMNEGLFELYLQPQVDRDKNIVGAEAFTCWAHPVRGVIMPDKFYPVLEKTGHAHLLDAQMWKMAIKHLGKWKDMGAEDMYLAVKISSKDFYYLNIYDVLTGCVEEYGVNPHNLKLEITETALMSNLAKFLELSLRLKKYGFEIEIDNFGQGYSSLNMLKDISADYLKLDAAIADSCLADNPDSRSKIIFDTIIEMAGKLGIHIVIDGVCDEIQDEYFKKAGCGYFQGDYYYEMLPAWQFDEKYIRGNRV